MLLKYFLPILIVLGLLQTACKNTSQKGKHPVSTHKEQSTTTPSVGTASESDDKTPPNIARNQDIPPKVFKVLKYVRENSQAPDGYVGGRIFQNRERHLPVKDAQGGKIKYQEWDVNPKKSGKNRGTQRLVTGSDGKAWYTDDHYATFKEVKE